MFDPQDASTCGVSIGFSLAGFNDELNAFDNRYIDGLVQVPVTP